MSFNYVVLIGTVVCGWVVLTCRDACAWGPGIHIAQGEYVLNNLGLIMPAIADLLRVYSIDFLYGCISADIFIGKGSRKRDDHCHNWAIGQKMLAQAQEPFEKAFTYGYLSHLAADTVAHNFFIPNQLYRTSSTRKVGHVYWECRSDMFTERRHWQLAKTVITGHSPQDDRIIGHAVRNRVLSFKTKKHIYAGTIRLYDLAQWRRAVEVFSRNSRWELSREFVDFYKHLSFSVTIDFLQDPMHARCLAYDPVGSDNIREAKRRRRLVKRLNGTYPEDMGFAIPEELLSVAASIDV